jgi:hypothetical protein
LSNAGETLRLEDGLGQVIHQFTYDDAWIASTDGQGDSLTIVDLTADPAAWNDSQSWRPSRWRDGSPGRDDAADLNGDRRLDTGDLAIFSAGIRANKLEYDFTGDGSLDHADVSFFVTIVFGIGFGDANLDGVFDSRDLQQVLQVGEYEDDLPGNSTWAEGDWNLDGEFNSSDLVVALQHGHYVIQAVAVRPSSTATSDLAAGMDRQQPSAQASLLRRESPVHREPRMLRDGKRAIPLQPTQEARQLIFAEPHASWSERTVADFDDLLADLTGSDLSDGADD